MDSTWAKVQFLSWLSEWRHHVIFKKNAKEKDWDIETSHAYFFLVFNNPFYSDVSYQRKYVMLMCWIWYDVTFQFAMTLNFTPQLDSLLFLSHFASSETERVSHCLWTTRWSRSWELTRISLELLIQLFTIKHARSVHLQACSWNLH